MAGLGAHAGLKGDDPAIELLGLIATERATTRADLVTAARLSRSTVAKRVQQLLEADLITEDGHASSSGGRPSRVLTFNRKRGITVGIDLGEDHTRIALTDLAPEVLVETIGATDLQGGPRAVMNWVNAQITYLLKQRDRPSSDLVGIAMAIPAPVDWRRGRAAGPSVMTGWDGFDIRGAIRAVHDVPVIVDNDVNLLGLAEARRHHPDARFLLYVKAGTGIGSALIANNQLYRGAQGAAGDIGHVYLHSTSEPLCRCGNLGCVEARTGGWAIARDLTAVGSPAQTARDVAELAQGGSPEAIRMLREAGRALGEAVAISVSMLNPDVLVVGGVLTATGDYLLTGIRESVYKRALPLATTNLRIVTSQLDERAGVLGAAQLVVDRMLRPRS